jgi:hypothetical protein
VNLLVTTHPISYEFGSWTRIGSYLVCDITVEREDLNLNNVIDYLPRNLTYDLNSTSIRFVSKLACGSLKEYKWNVRTKVVGWSELTIVESGVNSKKTLNDKLHRLVGLQKYLKTKRAILSEELAKVNNFIEVGSFYPVGRGDACYVPHHKIKELTKIKSDISKNERRIKKTREEIKKLEASRLRYKANRLFQRSVELLKLDQSPTKSSRDWTKTLLKSVGLFLHNSDEISDGKGRLVGTYISSSILKWDLQVKISFREQPSEVIDINLNIAELL